MDLQLGFFDAAFTDTLATASAVVESAASTLPAYARSIENIADHLRSGALSESELVAIGRAHNIEDIQCAYNSLEGAMVVILRDDPTIDMARTLVARIPAQRRRSIEKETLQQFSTPPTIALVLQQLANVQQDDITLEPSAGTGLLVATIPGSIVLNEIDRDRRQILRAVFPEATISGHDGRYIDALYKGTRPTVVLMNPPFSMDMHGANGKAVGLDHLSAAIRLAAPGARIVALLGDNQHPEHTSWASVLDGRCSLRLAQSIDGRDYYKMGTTFNVCLVVIDKVPEATLIASSTNTLRIDDIAKLPVIPREASTRLHALTGTRTRTGATSQRGAFVPIFSDITTLDYRYERPQSVPSDGERFIRWATAIHVDGAAKHPAKLVESTALGSVYLPPVSPDTTPVRLPAASIAQLSDAQLESLVYIRRALSRKTEIVIEATVTDEDGGTSSELTTQECNGGVLIGHGTGFGKGRLMASTILSEIVAGNPIALYFSENQSLFEDFLRDWTDVVGAQHASAVQNLSSYKANDTIAMKAGVIYSTYATLRVGEKESTRSRVQQLVASVGEDFAGIIVFDEVHNLANAIQTRGARGMTGGSIQGAAALALQRALPKAKIVYVSATCASTVEAYAYAERLGLWGPKAPFPDRSTFMLKMNAGGVGALEMLTRDLKAQGLYLATSLSLEGVTVERITHILEPEQVDSYNAVARAWRIIYEKLDAIVAEHDSNSSRSARAAIASARQRSLQAMLGSLAMPSIMADQHDKLARGFSIVGQITNTYEAAQEAALSQLTDPDDLENIDVSPKQTMIDYLDRVFPVMRTIIVKDDEGKERSEILKDDRGLPVLDPRLVAIRDDLKAQIASALMPDSMLTMMLDEHGVENVGEISGRKRRLVRKRTEHGFKRVLETRCGTANIDDTSAFQTGAKRVLIFTEAAGGTGRSYNDARTNPVSYPRGHYLLQTGWRSDRAVQGFGRTLRSNSYTDPHWILCETNAPGQKRFISTIAKRMETLGATTRGQRDAASTGLFSSEDNLETEYGQAAVNDLLKDIAFHDQPITLESWLAQTNASLLNEDGEFIPKQMPQFLNYVLSCDLGYNEDGPQNILMNALLERIAILIERAKQSGSFDYGLQSIKALSLRVDRHIDIHTTTDGIATTLTHVMAKRAATKHSFATVLSHIRTARAAHGTAAGAFGYDHSGNITAYYQTANSYYGGKPISNYTFAFPDHLAYGENYAYLPKRLSDEEAEAPWKEAFAGIDDTYEQRLYVVTGSILPIMRLLPETLRAVVANTDTGERVLGILLDEHTMTKLLETLKIDENVTTADILARVLNGKVARYDNLTLKAVRFGHEQRIEINVPQWSVTSMAKPFAAAGVDVERVNYTTRFFLPVHNTAAVADEAFANRVFTGFD